MAVVLHFFVALTCQIHILKVQRCSVLSQGSAGAVSFHSTMMPCIICINKIDPWFHERFWSEKATFNCVQNGACTEVWNSSLLSSLVWQSLSLNLFLCSKSNLLEFVWSLAVMHSIRWHWLITHAHNSTALGPSG